MSNKYYYFTASLPMLMIDSPVSMSVEEFLSQCTMFLSQKDSDLIFCVLSEDTMINCPDICDVNKFLNDWLLFNRGLKNELAAERAEASDLDPVDYMRGFRLGDSIVLHAVSEAMKKVQENPLDAEKNIDRARWQFLDNQLTNHYFDFETILSFGLKLKILERYQSATKEDGIKKFEEYQTIALSALEK